MHMCVRHVSKIKIFRDTCAKGYAQHTKIETLPDLSVSRAEYIVVPWGVYIGVSRAVYNIMCPMGHMSSGL